MPDASIAFVADLDGHAERPPIRPRARLAARAVRVPSRRSFTSNCPRAAKMWMISRPIALVMSMFSMERPQPDAACLQGVHGDQKLAHGSHQIGLAGRRPAHRLRGRIPKRRQARAIRAGAAHRFLEHPLTPGSMEGVDLAISSLQIGRDAGIANQHRKSPRTLRTPVQSEFWDAAWPSSGRHRNQTGVLPTNGRLWEARSFDIHIHHTTTGIGSMIGKVIACWSCYGMMAIRSGSTSQRHRPRSAASLAVIIQIGAPCFRALTTTSSHPRRP